MLAPGPVAGVVKVMMDCPKGSARPKALSRYDEELQLMADFSWFLFTIIPGLACAVRSLIDYRKGIGKPVGPALLFVDRTLVVLVVLELLVMGAIFWL